jgi:hypothetical protein
MIATAKLREDLHSFIDTMPEKNIQALWPIVSILAEPEYAIETDLTDEEHALIAESVQRYHSDPARFVPLKNLL